MKITPYMYMVPYRTNFRRTKIFGSSVLSTEQNFIGFFRISRRTKFSAGQIFGTLVRRNFVQEGSPNMYLLVPKR